MSRHAPATKHVWKFFRTGGLDQVALETAEDLLALGELDQKLWVALSCPVNGLELDRRTLELIDTDQDGHIHVREVVTAVQWAAAHLKRPADLLNPEAALPLSAINDLTPEGRTVLASARRILENLGKPDAPHLAVDDTSDTAKILAAKAPNGDGVVTLRATSDAETQALIKDIIATTSGVPDRAGGEGVNAEKVDLFFHELDSYLKWLDATATRNLRELGDATGPACRALHQVRPKVDEFFARCRLAAFDTRAVDALNKQEIAYLDRIAENMTITEAEVAALPLARVAPHASVPLLHDVNPAWAAAMADVYRSAIVPLYGPEKTTLSAADWADVTAKFAPFETWLGGRTASPVEKLGPARARAIASGVARARLAELIAQDRALASDYNAISSVARLVRYYRDLRTLLHNFVNFADFYSRDRWAVFQAGMLFLDGRSPELCVRVADPASHARIAGMSNAYIAYLDCKRAGGETMKIAACFTQGDSDYLFVGRNGLFYDRQFRDWDATITRIVENPISIRQAFWSPYKKLLRAIEEHVTKRAAAADTATTAKIATVTAPPPTAPGAPPKPPTPAPPRSRRKLDVGTVAALGVGLGALTTAFGMVFAKFVEMPAWQLPLAIGGIMLAISLPSVIIAWVKIRQRTLGPLLEANGWAINGRVKINVPLGTALTPRAQLPANARRLPGDPYDDRGAWRRKLLWIALGVLLVAALIAARALHTWPFESASAAVPRTVG